MALEGDFYQTSSPDYDIEVHLDFTSPEAQRDEHGQPTGITTSYQQTYQYLHKKHSLKRPTTRYEYIAVQCGDSPLPMPVDLRTAFKTLKSITNDSRLYLIIHGNAQYPTHGFTQAHKGTAVSIENIAKFLNLYCSHRSLRKPNEQNLRISLLTCEAGATPNDLSSDLNFAVNLHKALWRDHHIYCSITARKEITHFYDSKINPKLLNDDLYSFMRFKFGSTNKIHRLPGEKIIVTHSKDNTHTVIYDDYDRSLYKFINNQITPIIDEICEGSDSSSPEEKLYGEFNSIVDCIIQKHDTFPESYTPAHPEIKSSLVQDYRHQIHILVRFKDLFFRYSILPGKHQNTLKSLYKKIQKLITDINS